MRPAHEQLGRECRGERDRVVEPPRHRERFGAQRAPAFARRREVALDGEPGEELAAQHRVLVVERFEGALEVGEEVEVGDAELVPPAPEATTADAEHGPGDADRVTFGAGLVHRAAQRETRVAEATGRAERPPETDEQIGAGLPAPDVIGLDELDRAFVRRDRVLVRELRVQAIRGALAVQHRLERVTRGCRLGEVVRAFGEETRVAFAVELLDRLADAAVQPDAPQ